MHDNIGGQGMTVDVTKGGRVDVTWRLAQESVVDWSFVCVCVPFKIAATMWEYASRWLDEQARFWSLQKLEQS